MSYVSVDKKTSEVPLGELTLAKAGQALVLLSNVDGKIYATSWSCPHEGEALTMDSWMAMRLCVLRTAQSST